MRVGVTMCLTDGSIRPAELAGAVEDRGLDELVLPERSHVPTSRTEVSPAGPPLPDAHRRALDPFVALGAAGAATDRLRLTTGVCLVAQHDPIVLAKTVATLDLLSGGRVTLGIGFGWHPVELANHGLTVANRRAVAREKVAAMRTLWADDEAAFDGVHVSFSPIWSWPKPVQRPGPPVYLGGGPAVFGDLVAYGDGWMPYAPVHDVAGGEGELRRLASAAGRDPDGIGLIVLGVRSRPDELDRYRALGATAAVFELPTAGRDDTLRRLDRLTVVAGTTGST